jgi:hypothetical protein
MFHHFRRADHLVLHPSSISRTRASMLQSGQGDPDERDEDANEEALDDGSDSDGSSFGAKSRMSFSYQCAFSSSLRLESLNTDGAALSSEVATSLSLLLLFQPPAFAVLPPPADALAPRLLPYRPPPSLVPPRRRPALLLRLSSDAPPRRLRRNSATASARPSRTLGTDRVQQVVRGRRLRGRS